jgi:mono/diheme cytochrome c family protein/plastocyanin
MTDTPGHEPAGQEPAGQEPEQRLPVPRPPVEPAPVERFTSAPSTRTFELSPERAAQVVRQSSNARWVGFLAVVVVILFVAIYWFYELGGPLGLTEPRLDAEAAAQQVTKVERGYNIYQANCARCHGADGEGGIGPTLNRQDKLFAHLNENYLRNVLEVGGRYVCGNPQSQMPAWSDTANPPGPLNYRQVDELIAYLLATNEREYIIRDEHLLDPKIDPITGEVMTFTGWRDPTYEPEPGATPYPACWADEFAAPSAAPSGSPAPGESAAPGESEAPAGTVIEISASSSTAFDANEFTVPADTAFQIHFSNKEAGVPHNVEVKDTANATIVRGDIITGVAEATYDVPALAAGSYPFICSVHPNMTGTITAE